MLMRTLLLSVFLGSSLFAFDLPTLIDEAQHNEQVQAYVQRSKAAEKEASSVTSAYLPQVNLGANATFLNGLGSFDIPQTYRAYAQADFVILDGFKRENLIDQKDMQVKASRFDLTGFKKAVSLQVIRLYFNLQGAVSDIKALEQKREQLNEQLQRFKLFKNAGIATDEDVERFKAAVADADYQMTARRYETDALRSKLQLLSGQPLEGAQADQNVSAPVGAEPKRLDKIDAMDYRVRALGYAAQQADSVYYPTLSVSDTYTYSDYGGYQPPFPGIEFADQQNRAMFQLSINLIDFGAAREQKEAIMLQKSAQELEMRYAEKSAEADRALALKAIERAKSLLVAAEKSRIASDRTFAVVKKKYEARVVDYIRYLDALSKATEARAQFARARSGLNIATASYIYNLGLDPKEYVK
jgi:outer membrane protein